jgi:hypothetical protein
MKKQHEQMTPDRLVDAATAVLQAVAEIHQDFSNVEVFPPDLMGTPNQPRCLCDFTKWEVQEATAFLMRLGYLERPRLI